MAKKISSCLEALEAESPEEAVYSDIQKSGMAVKELAALTLGYENINKSHQLLLHMLYPDHDPPLGFRRGLRLCQLCKSGSETLKYTFKELKELLTVEQKKEFLKLVFEEFKKDLTKEDVEVFITTCLNGASGFNQEVLGLLYEIKATVRNNRTKDGNDIT